MAPCSCWHGGDNLVTPRNGELRFWHAYRPRQRIYVTSICCTGTQFEGCIVWGFSGTRSHDPVSPVPLVDCGHNDSWSLHNQGRSFGSPNRHYYYLLPRRSMPAGEHLHPRGSNYSATWTDNSGNLWLLTGDVFSSTTPRREICRDSSMSCGEFTGTNITVVVASNVLDVGEASHPSGIHPPGRLGRRLPGGRSFHRQPLVIRRTGWLGVLTICGVV